MINYFMLFFAIGTLAFNMIRFKKSDDRYSKIGKVICTVVLITSYTLSALAGIWYFVVIHGIYDFDNELIGKVGNIDWTDSSMLREFSFELNEDDNSMKYGEYLSGCTLEIVVADIDDSYTFEHSLDGIEYSYKLYPTWTWEFMPCFINTQYQFKTDKKIITVTERYNTDICNSILGDRLDKMGA